MNENFLDYDKNCDLILLTIEVSKEINLFDKKCDYQKISKNLIMSEG